MIEIKKYAFESVCIKTLNVSENVEVWEAFPGNWSQYIEKINVAAGNKLYSSQNGALYSKDFSKLVVYPKYKTGAAIIPNSVKELSDRVFYNCKFDSITLPNGITSLPNNLFEDCVNLKNVNFPDGLEDIGFSAFSGCCSLEKLKLPKGIVKITNTYFNGMDSFKSINVDAENNKFYSDDGILYSKGENSELILCPPAHIGNIHITEGTVSVNENAFKSCKEFEKIYVHSSVRYYIGLREANHNNFVEFNVAENNAVFKSVDGVLYNKQEKSLISCPGAKCGRFEIEEGTEKILKNAILGKGLAEIVFPRSVIEIENEAVIKSMVNFRSYAVGKTLYGFKDSCVMNYAEENWFPFVAIDAVPDVKIIRDNGKLILNIKINLIMLKKFLPRYIQAMVK